jgi:hypothetical protein
MGEIVICPVDIIWKKFPDFISYIITILFCREIGDIAPTMQSNGDFASIFSTLRFYLWYFKSKIASTGLPLFCEEQLTMLTLL